MADGTRLAKLDSAVSALQTDLGSLQSTVHHQQSTMLDMKTQLVAISRQLIHLGQLFKAKYHDSDHHLEPSPPSSSTPNHHRPYPPDSATDRFRFTTVEEPQGVVCTVFDEMLKPSSAAPCVFGLGANDGSELVNAVSHSHTLVDAEVFDEMPRRVNTVPTKIKPLRGARYVEDKVFEERSNDVSDVSIDTVFPSRESYVADTARNSPDKLPNELRTGFLMGMTDPFPDFDDPYGFRLLLMSTRMNATFCVTFIEHIQQFQISYPPPCLSPATTIFIDFDGGFAMTSSMALALHALTYEVATGLTMDFLSLHLDVSVGPPAVTKLASRDENQSNHVFDKDEMAYLPNQTPLTLRKYREQELERLRGAGNGQLGEADRVYDFAYYNDLGEPHKGPKHVRPILGGSIEYPYPRRIRTGRPRLESADPKVESRLPLPMSINIYVPRDEQFHHLKKSDFIVDTLKAIAPLIGPELPSLFGKEFHSFEDVLALYVEGIKLSQSSLLDDIKNRIPLKIKEKPFKFPIPQVIQEDKSAWMTAEEFAREMIAGVNPVPICLVEEFPPRSRLDHRLYGDQKSSITKEHLENSLDGLSVDKAIEKNKLFILDHHETLMPYLRRINETSTKVYASSTILFLKDDGTLKPVAILFLPQPCGQGCLEGDGHVMGLDPAKTTAKDPIGNVTRKSTRERRQSVLLKGHVLG